MCVVSMVKRVGVLFATLHLFFPFGVGAEGLGFYESGKKVQSYSLASLKEALPVHNVDIFDPQYNKNKQYQAFKLHDVLAYVYGDAWLQKLDTDVNFIALDGYQAVSDYKKVLEQGGYIVFKDRQYPEWEGIGRKKASPGPFYLVWDDKQKGPKKGYPWPYQLAKIDTVDFKQQYPAVYPHDVAKSSDIYAGFALFKERCMKCHAIDQEGGKVGPDLNAPMNILTYRQRDMVGEYIRQPSKFRYTQMPDHLDLKSSQIDSLLDYLQHQGKLSKK